ncbi:hypothetical protein ENH_00015220 [Eimeria necatrix]|uniref:Uncharacterized protein n=1 Tax=Eimeria necatrix TaxID=51315 RepID=U6MQ54_9EIME|nr:hypothetical protein ENH_00015220 [Eimeria necatrix]CDJ66136.1 hypothetical protein ENH_00015220 [Eimeria necatrix]
MVENAMRWTAAQLQDVARLGGRNAANNFTGIMKLSTEHGCDNFRGSREFAAVERRFSAVMSTGVDFNVSGVDGVTASWFGLSSGEFLVEIFVAKPTIMTVSGEILLRVFTIQKIAELCRAFGTATKSENNMNQARFVVNAVKARFVVNAVKPVRVK